MKTKLTVLVILLLSSLSFAQTTQPTVVDTIKSITTVGTNLTKVQAELLVSIPPGILKQPIVATQPTPGPTTQTSIPAGTELSTFTFESGSYIAAGDCTVTGWVPTVAGVTINGNGFTLTGIKTTNTSTLIDSRTISGLKIYSWRVSAPGGATIFRPGPDSEFVGNRILTSVETVVECDYPQGDDAIIKGNIQDKAGGSRFVLINGADDVQILNNQIAGSTGEDAIRAMPLAEGHIPARGIIRGNVIAYASTLSKSSISLRSAQDFIIDGNTLTGWLRLGEQSPTPTVTNVTITGNTFNPEPKAIEQVSFKAATGQVNGNTFLVNATQWMINGSGDPTNLKSADSNTIKVAAGVTPRPLINFNAGQYKSNGTNTHVVH